MCFFLVIKKESFAETLAQSSHQAVTSTPPASLLSAIWNACIAMSRIALQKPLLSGCSCWTTFDGHSCDVKCPIQQWNTCRIDKWFFTSLFCQKFFPGMPAFKLSVSFLLTGVIQQWITCIAPNTRLHLFEILALIFLLARSHGRLWLLHFCLVMFAMFGGFCLKDDPRSLAWSQTAQRYSN